MNLTSNSPALTHDPLDLVPLSGSSPEADTPPTDATSVATSVATSGTPVAEPCPELPQKLTFQAELQIFLSTFFTIFLAEVGDKTQLTVLLMSAESGSPWVVFLGAGSALIATSLCGVLLGRWLSTRVSPKILEKSAAVLLLLISALLIWDVWRG